CKEKICSNFMSRKVRDLSRETLNLPHMMGLPNRALEPISRSWSFCADIIGLNPAQDLPRRQSLRDCADVDLERGRLKRQSLRDCAGEYWQ
ncbi:hypothetical protein, partial [Mesorhizobium shangrilense]